MSGAWEVSSLNVHRNGFQAYVRVKAGLDVHPDTANRLACTVETTPEMLEELRHAERFALAVAEADAAAGHERSAAEARKRASAVAAVIAKAEGRAS